jgi:hypothetical protein
VTAVVASPEQSHNLVHVQVAVRYLLLVGVVVGVVGVVGQWLAWPLITSTVGPTAYMFAAHPESETSRFRNALIGHTVAVGAGLGSLAIFGLLHHASVSTTGAPTWSQAAAAAMAAGVTVAVLEIFGSHHAPAAATALLIATGLAKPGAPLIGLVLGLAVVITIGPLLGRVPFARRASTADQTGGRFASGESGRAVS